MTHKELVRAAVRWLTNTEHCGVVLAEISAAAMERPDAIGWQAHKSIVVECKASRSDFLADKNKPSARIRRLVGNERYYLCEPFTIRPEDLQGTPYGLMTIDGSQCRMRVKATNRALSDVELMDERTMLVSALRRIQTREFLTIVPLGADEVLHAPGGETDEGEIGETALQVRITPLDVCRVFDFRKPCFHVCAAPLPNLLSRYVGRQDILGTRRAA